MRTKSIVALLVLTVLVSACVAQSDPYKMTVGGQKMTTRANLQEADKVPVYPDISTLKGVLLTPDVGEIRIAYIPANESNGFYTVTGFELSYKMVIIQKAIFGDYPKIDVLVLNSTDEAYRLASVRSPVIIMKAGSDRTAVTVDGNVVIVEGKDMTENGRTYTDLDLAADKLLLSLLEV
jgi:hypothetical protein